MERTDFEQWKAKEVARLLALVETERRYYQEMVAVLPLALVVLAGDRSVASANRAFRVMFNLKTEDLRRKTIDQILPSERLLERIRDMHSSGQAHPWLFVEHEGKPLRVALIAMRNWDEEGELETLLLIEDLSSLESAKVVSELSSQPVVPALTELQIPFGDIPAILWQADPSTLVFRAVKGAVESTLGYPVSHWIDTKDFFSERIHPEDRRATIDFYRGAIERGGEASAEFRGVTASGGVVWLRETIRVAAEAITGVITSIGRRKQLEEQLLRAERTNALQGVSSRLAHDLNNPLMIVSGYAEELRDQLPEGDAKRNDLSEILTATERMSGIAGQLLGFTRRHANVPEPVNVPQVLAAIEEKIVHAAGEGITVELGSEEAVWACADATQLEEVVLALVSGAREEARQRTHVVIACDLDTIAEQVPGATLGHGRYVRLSIHDDGHGLAPQQRGAIFESFLVKDAQKNHGAALAKAYAVVREWGGDIAFFSEPFRGSTFLIYLPQCDAPGHATIPEKAADIPAAKEPEIVLAEPLRETILVVEDELGIRALVRKILRRERYRVIEAGSAEEALAIASGMSESIDLLLTDVMLPGLTGRQLADRIRETRAGLKVVYVSGYTDDESVRTGDFPPGSKFLQKPFTLGSLVAKIREALDA